MIISATTTLTHESIDGVLAVDVHEFMVRKARTGVITQDILNAMQFSEVELFLHQVEKLGNIAQFVTGLKFASIFVTSTQATEHMFVHTHFWYGGIVHWIQKEPFLVIAPNNNNYTFNGGKLLSHYLHLDIRYDQSRVNLPWRVSALTPTHNQRGSELNR